MLLAPGCVLWLHAGTAAALSLSVERHGDLRRHVRATPLMSSEKRRRRKRDRILRTFTRRHDHRASSAASEEHADGGRQHVASEAATAASAASAAASTAADAEVVRLEQQIANVMRRTTAFQSAQDVYAVQDLLFRRFRAKYAGSLGSDYLSEQQAALLTALMKGNVPAIRRSLASGESWDFVFPPAPYAADGSRVMQLEGRCRSPLALLVRPDEGNLEALSSGAADANYPRGYWSSPGAHACFEGDVEALSLLHRFGLNLEQKVEWLLQPSPSFTYAHAAAFNGNANVLTFMRQRARLLDAKSRFEYRWWGNDLFWFSFDGIVLPCTHDGRAMPIFDGARRSDRANRSTTVEQLIVRHDRRELLTTPVMRFVLERKWDYFAAAIYQRRFAQYMLMVGGLLGATVSDVGSAAFAASCAACVGSWGAFVLQASREVAALGPANYLRSPRVLAEWRVRRLLNALDSVHLLLVPLVPAVKACVAAGALDPSLRPAVAPVAAALQLSLALRALQYVALNRSLGPLLVIIVEMFGDILSFVGLYAFILLGLCRRACTPLATSPRFANGFYVLFSADAASPSYGAIVETQLLWLLGNIDFDFFGSLADAPVLLNTAYAFFWVYTSLSVFVMLNLLIAIFNSTYERVAVESEAEWLWLRLEAMLDFEVAAHAPGIDAPGFEEYYSELRERNKQRAVR
ncbi:hypothetical protein EMIHUDRAFT_114254 [Emiliania huxleyi CCMP1516]|uniref:Ion transport domain-containing protein n=2 Tax=Emiliania huxleyi TaxID=2903 RepID=A0A0D3JXI2_EMIH1|nr:hypothetical protein EMIHUDRAFT_114254 [Emiliania huxleyi CCMP1516]EOD28217.1 hypothetical protein EMIHUDRAFT_114254 [Emiliania huxleyi CCMP1516]|eukprot:XP_005780646.1 hypothetical protein EMIHUDRAFT_114254 [Emiliania huxleyi CCMP1516]